MHSWQKLRKMVIFVAVKFSYSVIQNSWNRYIHFQQEYNRLRYCAQTDMCM